MKKIYIFVLGVVVGTVITFLFLYTVMYIDSRSPETVPIDTIDVAPDDTTSISSDPYIGMTEEEFIQEMMKGVQGDYTLEQVDSMRRSWSH